METFPTIEIMTIMGLIFVSIVFFVCKSKGHIHIEIDLKRGKFKITKKKD